jgi:putative Holliday junction resolvase
MIKYMGLDLGSKTLGLSISESGIIANNLTTLYFKEHDYEEAVKKMVEVIDQYKITCLVIGYPKHMNNDVGIRAKISEDFKESILKVRPIEIVLWDERLSTRSAITAMIGQKQSRSKQKQKKDELAATLILQNYLDYKRG